MSPPPPTPTLSQLEARIRFLLTQLRQEIQNRDWRLPPKPWNHFIERFTMPPKDVNAFSHRLIINSHIYQTNYCMILGAALIYYILRRPSAIFVVGLIVVAWVFATSPKPLVLGGRRITRQEKVWGGAGVSLIVLVVSGVLGSFVRVMGNASFLVLLHAAARHTSARYKVGEIRTQMSNRW